MPTRTCLGCRGRDEQGNLVRLVRVDGRVVDATRPRLPGRGGYLHHDPACWELADRRRAIQRFFGADAALEAGLAPDWAHGGVSR